ncbi:hypothetical protein BU17DRAFT_92206 [Hysterangium stoloniferum]|nr:hypothetical protein BU17DRAFT_92206 [Hysterangium stoloniferum]
MPVFLGDLPIEIVEHIVSEIEHPRDLLSLALSNSSLKNIIIPYHIQFRHIACDPCREYLWQYLSDHPHLAARIRQIEIIPEGEHRRLAVAKKVIVPGIIPGGAPSTRRYRKWDHADALLPLAAAIVHMPNLRRFGVIRSYAYAAEYLSAFLAVMYQNCPNLTEFQAAIGFISPPHSPGLPESSLKNISHASGLSRMSLMVGSSNRALVAAVLNVLYNSPGLQELSLWGSKPFRPSFLSLLRDGHWRMLKHLMLRNILLFRPVPDEEVQKGLLASFFARHDQLVSLCMDEPGIIVPDSLRPGALPKLRSLQLCLDSQPLSVMIPSDMRNRLSFLAVDLALYDIDDITDMKCLRRLWITTTQRPSSIATLVKAAPQLHRLRFGTPSGETCSSYAKALSCSTELTHLYINPYSHTDHLTSHSVAEKLAVVPKLKYVSQAAASTLGVEIIRDSSGEFSSHKDCRVLAGDNARESWGDTSTDVFATPYYL